MSDKKVSDKKTLKPEDIQGVPIDLIDDSRESIAGLIGQICYQDSALLASLKEEGFTEANIDKIKTMILRLMERIGKPAPNLDWMDKVEMKVVINDDKNYTIPLPHQK